MSAYIIDVQGFRGTFNEYLPVEVTILSQATGALKHFLIRREEPLFYWFSRAKHTNNWLRREYHGLKWDQGSKTMANMETEFDLIGWQTIIYTKGIKNANFLGKYFWKVFELHGMGCPAMSNLPSGVPCWKHIQLGTPELNCTRKNVVALNYWLDTRATQTVEYPPV